MCEKRAGDKCGKTNLTTTEMLMTALHYLEQTNHFEQNIKETQQRTQKQYRNKQRKKLIYEENTYTAF